MSEKPQNEENHLNAKGNGVLLLRLAQKQKLSGNHEKAIQTLLNAASIFMDAKLWGVKEIKGVEMLIKDWRVDWEASESETSDGDELNHIDSKVNLPAPQKRDKIPEQIEGHHVIKPKPMPQDVSDRAIQKLPEGQGKTTPPIQPKPIPQTFLPTPNETGTESQGGAISAIHPKPAPGSLDPYEIFFPKIPNPKGDESEEEGSRSVAEKILEKLKNRRKNSKRIHLCPMCGNFDDGCTCGYFEALKNS